MLEINSIVGYNRDADIAVLETEPLDLPSVSLGNFDDVIDGLEVAFIGFPLSFDFQISHRGIVSSKCVIRYEKEFEPVSVVTINSFVNYGNSGGPLITICDEPQVIGVINARKSLETQPAFLKIPERRTSVRISGVDPVEFPVQLYNRAIGLIGELGQVGIGFSTSIEYIKEILSA